MKTVLGNDMQLGCTEFVHAYRAEAVLDIFKMSAFCCSIKSRYSVRVKRGRTHFLLMCIFRLIADSRMTTATGQIYAFSDLSTCLCNPVFADAK